MSDAPKPRYAYHNPRCRAGEVCDCGRPFLSHRVEHQPSGSPCQNCGLPETNHYRKLARKDRERAYCVGIDGEGQGRADHQYVMLAYSNDSGTIRNSIESQAGKALTTVECLDFILTIPPHAKVFAFAFQYDLTKILADCDDSTIYRLWRPDLRQRPPDKQHLGPIPVVWRGYVLNMLGSKFTVEKAGRRTVIWDCFKFFQSKFTKALEDWKIASAEELAEMRAMKDQRSDFDKLGRAQILRYCYSECEMMASLAEKLVRAHQQAGLTLKSYHGAGSTASCVLKQMEIDKAKRTAPKEMDRAVASAFFGGRFENRVVGVIKGPLYSRDISSAYPYQTTFLPCLECGSWTLTRERQALETSTTALVHYRLGKAPPGLVWGPLPFRSKDGSICFPASSGGGWVWRDEYLAAEAGFTHVEFVEAWVYHTECNHRPFADVPTLYLERLRLGKEGPGIVIKLGTNAIYGKLAQSKGVNPPFQSWVWAGMITSGTRAEILRMLNLHSDPRNLYMIATDGIYTSENFEAPAPRDTGTYTEKHKKPLGGWETKTIDGDMFAARPGIYYPLNPTAEQIAQVRARGVGRTVVLQYWSKIMDAWQKGERSVTVGNVVRFNGAKSSIGRTPDPLHKGKFVYNRFVDEKTGVPRYGQWCTRQIDMTFHPMPKRARINADGSLSMRHLPNDYESEPYKPSVLSMDALALRLNTLEILEQPDGADFVEYDDE